MKVLSSSSIARLCILLACSTGLAMTGSAYATEGGGSGGSNSGGNTGGGNTGENSGGNTGGGNTGGGNTTTTEERPTTGDESTLTTHEYPNGTVYAAQDKTRGAGSVVTVKTEGGNQTIDCSKSESACRAALEAALASGQPRYQTYSSVDNALRSPLVSKYPQLRQWLQSLQRR